MALRPDNPFRTGFTLLVLALSVACVRGQEFNERNDPRLFTVTFASDDKPSVEAGHTVETYWISAHREGTQRFVTAWALQGAEGPIRDGADQAKKCLAILKKVNAQDDAGTIPVNDRVTFWASDENAAVSRVFDRHALPDTLGGIFTSLAVRAEHMERFTFAHAVQTTRQAKLTFLVVYSPGPSWIKGKSSKDQPLKEHFQFMVGLFARGVMKFAGPFSNADGGAAVIEATDEADARSIIAADPALRSGIMTTVIKKWDLIDWKEYLKK